MQQFLIAFFITENDQEGNEHHPIVTFCVLEAESVEQATEKGKALLPLIREDFIFDSLDAVARPLREHIQAAITHGAELTEKLKQHYVCFPEPEEGEYTPPFAAGTYSRNQVVNLLRKHKTDPRAVEYIADLLEE